MTTAMYSSDCPWCETGGARYCRRCSGSVPPPAPPPAPARASAPAVLQTGQRVRWKGRDGTVRGAYLLPPRCVEPMAYVVLLDDCLAQSSYRGQIVPAHEVTAL